MDVRGRRLRKQSDASAAFTSSMPADGPIASHVVRISMAHLLSLARAGIVGQAEARSCLRFLEDYATDAPAAAPAEDFHQRLEQDAVNSLGVKVAGMMNYGKSRNDQVATAIRMELRARLLELAGAIIDLQMALMRKARTDGALPFPGYTHLQRAQPVTFGHYLFAHSDALERDVERVFQVYDRANLSPMGSGALGGTSVRVDRKLVAKCLGFDGLVANAMDAVSSRDVELEAIACATLVLLDLSRMSEEQILWSSSEFGLVEVADEHSASSSIMPQKKNPVVAEVGRAKAGSVIGELVSACAILKSLPYSYNLDLQEVTPHLWRALRDAMDSVRLVGESYVSMKLDADGIRRSMAGDYSTATAFANHLVETRSVSFREAHSMTGELVRIAFDSGVPFEDVAVGKLPTVSASHGKPLNIGAAEARSVLDPQAFLSGIVTYGGANPRFVAAEALSRTRRAERNRAVLRGRLSSLKSSERYLLKLTRSVVTEVKDQE